MSTTPPSQPQPKPQPKPTPSKSSPSPSPPKPSVVKSAVSQPHKRSAQPTNPPVSVPTSPSVTTPLEKVVQIGKRAVDAICRETPPPGIVTATDEPPPAIPAVEPPEPLPRKSLDLGPLPKITPAENLAAILREGQRQFDKIAFAFIQEEQKQTEILRGIRSNLTIIGVVILIVFVTWMIGGGIVVGKIINSQQAVPYSEADASVRDSIENLRTVRESSERFDRILRDMKDRD
ncbi:MAG: hypothetical protein ACYC3X_06140 [Pirellulaceae bacterium]